MLTGSARVVQEAKETAAAVERKQETERRQRELERKRHEVENQIATLRAELEAEENEVQQLAEQAGLREERRIEVRDQMARMRQSDGDGARQASRRVDLRGGRK
jgi:circadian clock protein KaiC